MAPIVKYTCNFDDLFVAACFQALVSENYHGDYYMVLGKLNMIKLFACDMMSLFQSKWYKMVRLIEGNIVTPQKIRPNRNRIR